MINVDVSVKYIIYMKKIMFVILLHVKYFASIMEDLAIICDEATESCGKKLSPTTMKIEISMKKL